MPSDLKTQGTGHAAHLTRLALEAFQLHQPSDLPRKLQVQPAAWAALCDYLEHGDPAPQNIAGTLKTVFGAMRAAGYGDRYLALMGGVRFPLAEAGVVWERQLGPITPAEEAFDHALSKLRWDQSGLWLRRRVAIAGEDAAWAIAGLLPTGESLKVAVRVRPEPNHLAALKEDLSDDAIAAAGFEVLAFRDWQLRFPGACALHVAHFCHRFASGLSVPAKLVDPDDDHPVHRAQAAPAVLTPRRTRPNWTLREALRAANPEADFQALLGHYQAQMLDRTAESADDEEWILWG